MNEEIIAKAAAFAVATRNCVLAQLDDGGYPHAATITPSKTEGIGRIYFGTGAGSSWARRAANCGRSCVCFTSDRPEINVTLVGNMEVVTDDLDLKKELWRDWMPQYWSGPDDPDFVVLRFSTRRYSLYMEGEQARGTLREEE